jgi:MYXO-CTERM domain-containing protein
MSRKYLSTVALAVALAIGSAGIAVAQQDTAPAGEATARAEEGFDWGWLGLLGLVGLAGLAGRRHERVRTTTTGTVR